MRRARIGTVIHRVPLRDHSGRMRDRQTAYALIADRPWAVEARYLGVTGRWHLFERPATALDMELRAARLLRDGRVHRRRTQPRATSSSPGYRGSQAELAALLEANAALLDPATLALIAQRPRTRADCVGGERPCPWVSCRHHLALDINPDTGSIKVNHPHRDIDQLRDTCALDVADRGPLTLEEIGVTLNITRERVRQVEQRGLAHLRTRSHVREL